jgi:hypothetical protein
MSLNIVKGPVWRPHAIGSLKIPYDVVNLLRSFLLFHSLSKGRRNVLFRFKIVICFTLFSHWQARAV